MTTDSVNTRELILEILLEVTERGQYSHLVIRSVLEKYQYLDKRERAFLTRVAEGTIQRQIELDYILDQFSKVKVRKMKPVIRAILRMGVYQLKYMDSVPASAAGGGFCIFLDYSAMMTSTPCSSSMRTVEA